MSAGPTSLSPPADLSCTPDPSHWEDWLAHLRERSQPEPLKRIFPGKRSCLGWGLGGQEPALPVRPTGKRRDPVRLAAELETWLAAAGQRDDRTFALQCLAWTQILPDLAELLPAAPWNDALDFLVGVARDAQQGQSREGLLEQLYASELPLTLARQFPELPACRELRAPARKQIRRSLDQSLDGDGLPEYRWLGELRPLLASWLRCQRLDPKCLNKKSANLLEAGILQAVQWTRHDGRQVLSDGPEGDWDPEFFVELTALLPKPTRRAARNVLPARTKAKGKKDAKASRRSKSRELRHVPSGSYSEWASLASMRSQWDPDTIQLAVNFGQGDLQSELNCGRETIWSGSWG